VFSEVNRSLSPLKSYLVNYLRRALPRYRKTPLVRFARRAAQVTYRFIENDNYNFYENGEQRVLGVLAKHLEVSTVFDVGANIGDYSAAASASFPAATIYAFEPVNKTFEILSRRLAGIANAKTFNYGLSDKDESVEFSVRPDELGNSTAHPAASLLLNPDAPRIVVPCKLRRSGSVADELGLSGIDLLKIDTEGNDWFVLNGFRDWLKNGRIKVIQFEYGMACIFTKRLLCDHFDLLQEYGYMVGKIYPTYVDFRPYSPIDEDFIGPNYLAVHDSSGLQKVL
jgi:FkbM family methyltransferase